MFISVVRRVQAGILTEERRPSQRPRMPPFTHTAEAVAGR